MAGMDHWQESVGPLLWDREIPLSVCIPYAVFVAILVPVYWRYYGPANFLWFSDLALLITLAAVWLESPLLASMEAVSVGLLELVWIADFVARLVFGARLAGMTDYMFKTEVPLAVRGLSLFHVVLPLLLFWLVYRLGYDERAWLAQTLLAWAVLLACYGFTERSQNINWVFGPGKPQQWLSPRLYLLVLMILLPGFVYLPTHFLLRALVPK
jgi:hypothetical protein